MTLSPKRSLASFALMLSMAFTSLATSASAVDMTVVEEANKQVVRDFMESLKALDMEKTTSYLAEDFTYQNGMTGKRHYGVQHFSDWWWSMVNNATELTPTIVRIEAMGNIVIIEKSSYYEDPENKMTFKGTNFFHVKDGKIKEYQEYRLPR